MEERVDIEINDKISPEVEKKLLSIASAAVSANSSLDKVVTNLSKIRPREINSLATAQAKLEANSAKSAVAMQRLATETSRTAAAQARAQLASEKVTLAQSQLSIAQARLSVTQNQIAASADRAAIAHLRLERAQARGMKSSSGFSDAMQTVAGKLLALYATIRGFGGLVSITDQFTFMENRLRAIGVADDQVSLTMQRLSGVATDTRNGLKSTVELYARLSQSTKQFNYSQKDLLAVTKAMNQAVRIGGSTTQEASNALIQLSQGMSSGRLQGDELRSVLEQLPIVADVISKHLGITRGELRKFGREGKLSTQAIMEAFIKAGPEMESRFSKLTMTVDEALTYLSTKFQVAMKGELGEALKSLAKAIVWVADNLNNLIPIVKALVGIGTGLYIATLVTKVGTFIKAMQGAVLVTKSFALVAPLSFATAGAAGNSAFRAILLGMNSVVGRIPTLLALLGTVYYAYQKINQEADKRQKEEEKQAATNQMSNLNTQLNNLNAEKIRLQGIINAKEYTGPRAEQEKASAATRLEALNKNIANVKKNYDAALAVLGDTLERVDGPDAFTAKLQSAFDKYLKGVTQVVGQTVEEVDKINIRVSSTDLRGLRSQYDQVYAAQMKYATAAEQVSYGLKTGVMTLSVANSIMSQVDKEYVAIIEPMNKYKEELDFQQKQLGLTNEQQEINNKLRELELVYMERGLALSPATSNAYRERLLLLQQEAKSLSERQKLITDIKGPGPDRSVSKVAALVPGDVTQTQAQRYLVKENPELFKGTQEAQEANIASYRQMYKKIEDLQAHSFMTEQSASKAKMNLWLKEHEVLLDSTEGTLGNIAQLTESSNRKLFVIGKTAANLQLAMNSVRAITEAWASAPWPANLPAITMATTAMAVQEAKLNGLAGFAFGGNFTVGGVGGIDSQTVAFRATPGEQVSVTTPEQRSRASESSGQTIIYQYHDHVEGGTKAERESRFSQFQRDTKAATNSRTRERTQVSV